MKKIGLLVSYLNDEFSLDTNALIMNSFILYNLIEEIEGYTPFIITDNKDVILNNKFNYFDKKYNCYELDIIEMKNLKLDILLCIFYKLNNDSIINIKEYIPNIKIGLVEYGNPYFCKLSQYLYRGEKYEDNKIYEILPQYDFIWISPHFEYCKEYLEVYYNTNISICPFIWEPILIDNQHKKFNYKFDDCDVKKIGIFESNTLPLKSLIIPTYICEKLEKDTNLINKLYLTNLNTYWKKKEFQEDFNNLSLAKKNKIECILTPINPLFKWIKEKNIKTIISHQTLNDLNYLHLETLYLGLPLIHNSETLKEYGYYYPNYSVNKGAEELKNVILNHKNNEKYLDKCKECIYKYSIYNKNNIMSYEKLLLDII